MGTVFSNITVWAPLLASKAPLDLRVEDGSIAAIAPSGTAIRPGDEVVDGSGKLALPGLVNAHTHVAMALLRGVADDVPLQPWLEEHIWPIERRLTAEDVYWGAALGLVEMVRSGTTQIVDMYFHVDETARAVRDIGMRATLSYGIVAESMNDKGRSELAEAERVATTWHGAADGRIRAAISPHSVSTCGEDVIREATGLAKRYTLPIHTHLAETKKEVDDWSNVHGVTPVASLETIGVFELPTLAAHCVHVNENDVERLAAHGVSVLHCPCSNAKLGSGVAPILAMQRAGVNVALGTDGAASNNNLDLLREMRTASLLQKAVHLDAQALPAETVLRMATENGAKALGLSTGRLDVGAPADVVIVDLSGVHVQPTVDPVSTVVYASHPDDVVDVMIGGRFVIRDRELMTLDEEEVREEARTRAERLRNGTAPPGTAA